MGISIVTPAAALCVTAAELRAHLVESNDATTAALEQIITEATEWVESRLCRALMTQTWLQTWDCFPDDYRPLKFDLQPVASVTWLKYYDTDGTLTTLSSVSDYWTDLTTKPPRIVPQNGWFATQPNRPSAVQAQFVAGYASAGAVPARAKLAIRMLAGFWFLQRPAVTVAQSPEATATTPTYGEIPFGVQSLCDQLEASGYT